MESLFAAFTAAVVGNLLWIGFELHALNKKLDIKAGRRNTSKDSPESKFDSTNM